MDGWTDGKRIMNVIKGKKRSKESRKEDGGRMHAFILNGQ